jgi:hypothetical protein
MCGHSFLNQAQNEGRSTIRAFKRNQLAFIRFRHGPNDQTWTGKISDSMCGAKHNTSAEHGAKSMSDRDCTLACVKDQNAKYLFVNGGKVYNVGNQAFS